MSRGCRAEADCWFCLKCWPHLLFIRLTRPQNIIVPPAPQPLSARSSLLLEDRFRLPLLVPLGGDTTTPGQSTNPPPPYTRSCQGPRRVSEAVEAAAPRTAAHPRSQSGAHSSVGQQDGWAAAQLTQGAHKTALQRSSSAPAGAHPEQGSSGPG